MGRKPTIREFPNQGMRFSLGQWENLARAIFYVITGGIYEDIVQGNTLEYKIPKGLVPTIGQVKWNHWAPKEGGQNEKLDKFKQKKLVKVVALGC